MPDLVPVRVRDCACPGTPHAEGDIVYLLPVLPFDGGILAEQQMVECATAGEPARLTRLWARTFVEHGAVSWNLTGEDGADVPFDREVLFADWQLARPVADKAADLYGESVMDPFLEQLRTRSPTSPTEPTTSPRRRRTPAPSA